MNMCQRAVCSNKGDHELNKILLLLLIKLHTFDYKRDDIFISEKVWSSPSF